jgi:hypothetical protein
MDSRLCTLATLCGAAMTLCGCAAGPNTTAGTAIGTGIGALTGAVIGSQTGHAGGGALIGAATGALAGGLVGNAEDARDERDAAIAHAHAVEAANYQAAQAMTNYDLVMMTQSGVSDDVIISAVNSRGGRFDLSPTALVQLKQSGVSDRVILSVQRAGASPPPSYVPAAYVPPPVTEVVVVRPRPVVGVGVVVGPRRHWHRHHCH